MNLLLDALAHPAQPWRNGGGRTRELFAGPDPSDWIFRISLAEVAADGPFSSYPGIERWITLVEGSGMRLQFPAVEHLLAPGTGPLRFDGALAPGCDLIDGPTTDLNLMVARGRATGSMRRAGTTPWRMEHRWRGLFAAQACALMIEGEPLIEIPAMHLLLRDDCADRAWSLRDAQGNTPLAWWISCSPGKPA